ncbi:ABC transporter substrate-binding protein [Paracoccus suum]|uniref:ABC transporter substrate-binding protein n=1 Tax=Paracoccus suum TaxID=2259340 RepID=A0A344PGB5_9RHOB|nr:ABC transporter substrate-binding protein [Paracoccus suum]AXC48420.1 ABC transporter substrate-binding protein [Paracoccus suum]
MICSSPPRVLLAASVAFASAAAPGHAAPAPDTLVIAQSVDIESLEPDMLNQAVSINVVSHIFGSLTAVTPEGEVVPYFATGWTWNEDGTELAFDIREGLTCEDGEVLDAEDVAYSLNRAADPANKFIGHTPGFIFGSIGFQGARAEGPHRAVMSLKGYSSTVPGMMSDAFIHCKDSYEKLSIADAATHPVASGPYKLVHWDKDQQVVLERNPTFTLEAPGFQRLVWRVIPEASSRVAELVAGNVDIAANVPPDQIEAVRSFDTADVEGVAGTRRMFVGFNFSDKFSGTPAGEAIKDKQVRHALNMAVDVPTICKQLLGTDCARMTGPANLGNPAVKPYPYDPEGAEKLLDEAGYKRGPDGVRFTAVMQGPTGRFLNDAQVQQAVAQYLSDIGVATTNELAPMNIFGTSAREHTAGPLYFIGQGGSTYSPIYDMSLFSSCDAPVNNGMWCNEEWTKRWEALKGIRDPADERKAVDEMLAIFADDAPWIFLYFQPDFYGVSNRIDWTPRRDESIDATTARLKG